MRKTLYFLFLLLILICAYFNREKINTFYMQNISSWTRKTVLPEKNEYNRKYKYEYLKETDNFIIEDKNQIKDVYYTIINSGLDKYTFYCSLNYQGCINDVKQIANNQVTLSNINSFVHPYNSFSSIETTYNSRGKINIKINKSYTQKQIDEINIKMKEILEKLNIKEINDKKEAIKLIHDYIINNSKYDTQKSDKNITNYASNIAYGPLLEGYGLCGGYTDSMALFLDYLDIPNFKVISENHIWNAVYIDNEWYHLDLTWDDPVTSNNTDVLEYNFFLIKTKSLEELETNQHVFDKEVFKELK